MIWPWTHGRPRTECSYSCLAANPSSASGWLYYWCTLSLLWSCDGPVAALQEAVNKQTNKSQQEIFDMTIYIALVTDSEWKTLVLISCRFYLYQICRITFTVGNRLRPSSMYKRYMYVWLLYATGIICLKCLSQQYLCCRIANPHSWNFVKVDVISKKAEKCSAMFELCSTTEPRVTANTRDLNKSFFKGYMYFRPSSSTTNVCRVKNCHWNRNEPKQIIPATQITGQKPQSISFT